MNTIIELIIAFLTGVLGPIVVVLVKAQLDNSKKKEDPITEAVVNANLVNDELEKIMETHSADRVWLAQFHNGGHYYPTGKSIQKFSIFFEFVKYSKDSLRLNFQNIPVNLFSKAFAKILSDDYLVIPDYKNEELPTYGLKYVADESGAKSSYIFGVRNVQDKLIAMLAVEYTTRKKPLSQEDIISLRLEAAKLGGVIMNQIK